MATNSSRSVARFKSGVQPVVAKVDKHTTQYTRTNAMNQKSRDNLYQQIRIVPQTQLASPSTSELCQTIAMPRLGDWANLIRISRQVPRHIVNITKSWSAAVLNDLLWRHDRQASLVGEKCWAFILHYLFIGSIATLAQYHYMNYY